MTTQADHVTQTHATMDLFAAFARQVMASPDDPAHDDDIEPTAIRLALWCLTDEAFPLSIPVVDAIHAERRRRLSAATREGETQIMGSKHEHTPERIEALRSLHEGMFDAVRNPAKAALNAALEECISVLELSDPKGEWVDINAPEDAAILALCERYGFGAVIDSAVRQWRRRDPVGAFTKGACVGTVQSALKQARKALKAATREGRRGC